MKTCTKCGTEKPISEFPRNRKNKDGRYAYCKTCTSAAAREWNRKNPERYKANTARWRQANKERMLETHRDWRNRNYYGITTEQYEAVLAEQAGACAICRQEPKGKTLLHVDHCHESNVVRGLLCNSCNNGLGRFKDDPARLTAAARYLRAANKKR